MQSPIKSLSRKIRVAAYLRANKGRFLYHGIPVSIPDTVTFSVKKNVMRGTYEEPERQLVERHLDPALPVVELGGSLGILSAYVNARLAPGVPYTIVEGNGALIDTCRANAASTRAAGPLSVIHAAVAYGADSVNFSVSGNTLGNKVETGPGDQTVLVPARTLSSLIGEESRGGYSLIMDIEGGEFDVVERDPAALAGCRLAIIEIHPGIYRSQGRSEADFLDLAEQAGLRPIDRIGDSLALAPG